VKLLITAGFTVSSFNLPLM